MKKPKTLADCNPDRKPSCSHCSKSLPTKTRIDVYPDYIVCQCPSCGCLTPFERIS